jgi:hypothetical protein
MGLVTTKPERWEPPMNADERRYADQLWKTESRCQARRERISVEHAVSASYQRSSAFIGG